jgi:hypothetical protein
MCTINQYLLATKLFVFIDIFNINNNNHESESKYTSLQIQSTGKVFAPNIFRFFKDQHVVMYTQSYTTCYFDNHLDYYSQNKILAFIISRFIVFRYYICYSMV